MLQQTQASVVVPFFHRFMKRFPTMGDLAAAPLEEVIKLWEGLGYYSRARNLHAAAKECLELFSGEIPSNPENLKRLKGIGPYTLGAVLCFGFHKKIAAVDANVMRVLTRLYAIGENISSAAVQKRLRELMESLLPDERPWEVMEGFIELGALICKKKPDCQNCPLAHGCQALRLQKADALPIKNARPETVSLHRYVSLIQCENSLLIRKRVEGIMKDLWEFPYLELSEKITLSMQQKLLEQKFFLDLKPQLKLPKTIHHFTYHKAHLYPRVWVAKSMKEVEGFSWANGEKIRSLPFSSGHRKVLNHFLEKNSLSIHNSNYE